MNASRSAPRRGERAQAVLCLPRLPVTADAVARVCEGRELPAMCERFSLGHALIRGASEDPVPSHECSARFNAHEQEVTKSPAPGGRHMDL